MSFEFISVETVDHILIVTMNRPEVHNAVHADMHKEMAQCWDDFAGDANLWVAILTGAGEKAFSAGNDLKAAAGSGGKKAIPSSGFAGLTSRWDLDKPIIAAVNGFALGGGFETALSCDIILASSAAKFALPEVKVGFFAAASGVQRLTRLIGPLAARDLLFSGRIIDAHEAHALGCVNEVCDPKELMKRAMEKAEQYCSVSPSSVRATKRVLNDLMRREGMQASIDFSLDVMAELKTTADFREGVNAFVEKRPPRWVNG
ncbi:MAG: enoyl-CoA hydratase-related protein [Alphaproteobacteria bacterium]